MSFFSIAKGFHKLSSHPPPDLTQKELDRLRAITIYNTTKDVSLVCKTYGISRASFYRWLKRFDPTDLNTLKNKSRRPRHLRKPMWTYDFILKVKELREQYPRWGKEKLCVLLRERGIESSASTVGRIIGYLKRRGELVEPQTRSKAGKRRVRRPYAIRKPVDWAVSEPGELVQFKVTSGPNAGLMSVPNNGECSVNNDCTTDGNGQVSWTYTGSITAGTDTIVASFFSESAQMVIESNTVEKIWVIPPRNIPTLSEWGLIAMAGILGIVGFMVMRRRKVAT